MAQPKLIIPAPGYEDDARAFHLAYGVTLLVVGVLLLGLAQGVMATHVETAAEREARLEAEARGRAEQRALDLSNAITKGTFQRSDLSDRDLLGALAYGRFDLAEEACLRTFARREQLGPERLQELVSLMNDTMGTRAGNMPLGCLVRAWFAGDLDAYPELAKTTSEVWQEISDGSLSRLGVAKMVEMYDTSRDRPRDPRFYHWLRYCSMRGGRDHIEWSFCVRMLRSLAPDHGNDFVEMTDVHITKAGSEPIDWATMARALGNVGGKGQPRDWTVLQHPSLLNFPYDIRIGAIYQLCRWVHAEDPDISSAASEGLGVAANISSHVDSPVQLKRWRFTCRYAFGAGLDRKLRPEARPEPVRPEVLAPVPGDLTLAGAVAAKRCARKDPQAPAWSCALDAWAGDASELDTALRELFIETRHLNWTREASSGPMPTADPTLPFEERKGPPGPEQGLPKKK